MTDPSWQGQFREVYDRGVAAYESGRQSPRTMFGADDVAFLASIGCTAQELFDFIEDALDYGEPDYNTALEITALRRDYFLNVMGGKPSPHQASMRDLPAKSDAVDGISWLPRLIVKARLKLRGEMPPDLMYGCGGDRPFLRRMRMTLPEFLRAVWQANGNDRQVIDTVKKSAGIR